MALKWQPEFANSFNTAFSRGSQLMESQFEEKRKTEKERKDALLKSWDESKDKGVIDYETWIDGRQKILKGEQPPTSIPKWDIDEQGNKIPVMEQQGYQYKPELDVSTLSFRGGINPVTGQEEGETFRKPTGADVQWEIDPKTGQRKEITTQQLRDYQGTLPSAFLPNMVQEREPIKAEQKTAKKTIFIDQTLVNEYPNLNPYLNTEQPFSSIVQMTSSSRAKTMAGGRLAAQNVKNEFDLRENFLKSPEVRDFVTVDTQVKSMDSMFNTFKKNNIEKNRVALDQALISMYNKLTDPQSVVRESEYARTPQNLPIVNRIIGAIQKFEEGGAGLTDADREALVLGGKIIVNERGNTYMNTRIGYENLSKEYKFDPKRIIGTLKPFTPYSIGEEKKVKETPKSTGKKQGQKKERRIATLKDF